MMKKILASGAAMAAALALTAPAQAVTLYSGFLTANAPSGVTQNASFSGPSSQAVKVFVQDCCIVADNYATYLDGNYIGTTPPVPAFGPTLSSATFLATLGLGTSHNVQLVDQYLGLLPAGVYVQIDSVPEPESWAMMLTGTFLMGGALRARRSRKSEGQLA
jgi:hypothetical protein